MNNSDYRRSNSNPGAILNTNTEALTAYKRNRELRWKNQEQEQRIENVESELGEIKVLLQKLLEKQG